MTEIRQMDDHDVIWQLAERVRAKVPGSLGWIAKQRSGDNEWCFAIGHGVACVSVARAREADDALVRELATQILGYPPDSPQDIARRQTEAAEKLAQIDDTLRRLWGERHYWQNVQRSLETLAERLTQESAPGWTLGESALGVDTVLADDAASVEGEHSQRWPLGSTDGGDYDHERRFK